MRIFITHVYSRDNAGDAAILSVLIKEIKREFYKPHITISTMEDISRYATYEEIPLITSFISLSLKRKGRINILISFFYVLFATLIWVFFYKLTKIRLDFILTKKLNRLLSTLSQSDLIIPVGGGYLRGTNNTISNANLFMLLFPLYISKLLDKFVALYSQSIGPFGNQTQKSLIKLVLNKLDLIILREDISIDILNKIGIKKNKMVRSVDAGFLFTSHYKFDLKNKLDILNSDHSNQIVGITVRQWLNDKEQHIYEQEMAKFIEYIVTNRSMRVLLIPQVTADMHQDDDRTVCIRVIGNIKNKKNVSAINDKLNQDELKSVYSSLDYIIGTRFHSIIFSLTSYVPAIAIEYEHKTSGIMKDLGLSEWVIKIEDVTSEKLIEKFDKLVNQKQKYVTLLHLQMPDYIKKATRAIEVVKSVFESRKK